MLGATTAHAQGQPNSTRSRTFGFDVYGHVLDASTATPNTTVIEIHGTPGASYALMLDLNLACVDSVFPTSPLLGPPVVGVQSLFAPIFILPSSGFFTDMSGAVPATDFLPASGNVTLRSTWSLPFGWVAPLFWQAVMDTGFTASGTPISATPLNPAGAKYLSNPQSRNPNTPGFPLQSGHIPGQTVPGTIQNDNQDVEQADVDNDGDMDHFVLSNAVGQLYLQVPGPAGTRTLQQPPIFIPLPQGLERAYTAEFADLDDDGFVDLIVGGQGLTYIAVYRNLGWNGSPPINWAGFNLAPATLVQLSGVEQFVTDLETGDLNGDRLIDIVAATSNGDPCVGDTNVVLINQTTQTGNIALLDDSRNLLPGIIDDTLDCELLDYDIDGDLDIVFANFEGPAPITGQDYILTNNGLADFTTVGPLILTITQNTSESTDVAVGDFNLDGLPDVFITNWYVTDGCDQTTLLAIGTDELYLNDSANPGSFISAEVLLPDNGVSYNGPTPIASHAGVDAEASNMPLDAISAGIRVPRDIDQDGDVDIVIALGSRASTLPTLPGVMAPNVPTPGINRGLIIYYNQLIPDTLPVVGTPIGGVPPFRAETLYTQFGPGLPITNSPDYTDIELGDWLFIQPDPATGLPPFPTDCCNWLELDIGCLTADFGHFTYKHP